MKISKLELERFINAYKDYKDSQDTTLWLNNREYLNLNGFTYTDIIELLVDHNESEIINVLLTLGVEIV